MGFYVGKTLIQLQYRDSIGHLEMWNFMNDPLTYSQHIERYETMTPEIQSGYIGTNCYAFQDGTYCEFYILEPNLEEAFINQYVEHGEKKTFDDKTKLREYIKRLDGEYKDLYDEYKARYPGVCTKSISIPKSISTPKQINTFIDFMKGINKIIKNIPEQQNITMIVGNTSRTKRLCGHESELYIQFQYEGYSQFITTDRYTYDILINRYTNDTENNKVHFSQLKPGANSFLRQYMLQNQGKSEELNTEDLYERFNNITAKFCLYTYNKKVSEVTNTLENTTASNGQIDEIKLKRMCVTDNLLPLPPKARIVDYDDDSTISTNSGNNKEYVAMFVVGTVAILIVSVIGLLYYCKKHFHRRSRRRNQDRDAVEGGIADEQQLQLANSGEEVELPSTSTEDGPARYSPSVSIKDETEEECSSHVTKDNALSGQQSTLSEDEQQQLDSEEEATDQIPEKPPRTSLQNSEKVEAGGSKRSKSFSMMTQVINCFSSSL